MEQFEKGPLRIHTPCRFEDKEKVVAALAHVHTELVLIHPFREGNGRLSRMLAILMALQANLPPLDFSIIAGKRRQEYFTAIQMGMDYEYKRMEEMFSDVVARSSLDEFA